MVLKTFDSFYFLHIPKTAGRFFTHNIVVPINDILIENNIKSFYNRDTYIAHQFWVDGINDNTYVVSLIRDPIKHLVSVYSHYSMLDDGAQRSVPVGVEQYNKNTMFQWMDKYYEYVKNLQSKNFLISNPDGPFIYSTATKNCEVSNEKIFDRLEKVALILKSEDLSIGNIKKIQSKILSDFGIEHLDINHKIQRASNYWNPDSTRIYNSLTEKDKQYILDFNSVDAEVYSTSSLFYGIGEKQ